MIMIEQKYANHHGWSDINPYEIIRVVSDKTIEVRAMKAEKNPEVKTKFTVGGFSAHSDNAQDWFIESDESRPVIRIRKDVRGQWKDKNRNRYHLADKPHKFYDYNF
jgi:hypothetical protein